MCKSRVVFKYRATTPTAVAIFGLVPTMQYIKLPTALLFGILAISDSSFSKLGLCFLESLAPASRGVATGLYASIWNFVKVLAM
jgi:hypothetical protein